MTGPRVICLPDGFLFYCEKDRIYIGYGASPRMEPPEGHDYQWLATHCWVCGRSKEDIANVQLS